MTIFKQGPVYLTCLMCGYGDFDIIRHGGTRGKALRCIRCGVICKEGRYFNPMPSGTPVPIDGSSLFTVKKKELAEINKK